MTQEKKQWTPAALNAFLIGDTRNATVASTPGGIEAQEALGQRELVASENLPKEAPWEEMEKLGFKRLEDVDDIFCKAEMPAGWKKVPTDHSMWSDIVDEKGVKRFSMFYKAAFYDRSAFMRMDG